MPYTAASRGGNCMVDSLVVEDRAVLSSLLAVVPADADEVPIRAQQLVQVQQLVVQHLLEADDVNLARREHSIDEPTAAHRPRPLAVGVATVVAVRRVDDARLGDGDRVAPAAVVATASLVLAGLSGTLQLSSVGDNGKITDTVGASRVLPRNTDLPFRGRHS